MLAIKRRVRVLRPQCGAGARRRGPGHGALGPGRAGPSPCRAGGGGDFSDATRSSLRCGEAADVLAWRLVRGLAVAFEDSTRNGNVWTVWNSDANRHLSGAAPWVSGARRKKS